MKINNNIFDAVRPERGGPVDPAGSARSVEPAKPVSPTTHSPRGDSVEFSDSARSLASRLTEESRAILDPERIAELRRKAYQGAYNTLDVVDQVARRILTRGDL